MISWEDAEHLIPYVLSLAISFAAGLYAWRRRHTQGAMPFAFVAWGQALWTFGYIFELASDTLASKIFWDDFQYIGGVIWPVALLIFSLEYTGRRLAHFRYLVGLATLPFAIFLALVATNRFHRLVRMDETLIPGIPFDELYYQFTLTFWIVFAWFLTVVLFSLALLVARCIHPHKLYRTQTVIVFLGTLVPLAGLILTAQGITLTFHRDTTPLTFAISNLCIAWGLFRYRLFDIVPIARSAVFENMIDSVIVVDSRSQVVDMNPAAAQRLGALRHDLIGESTECVFGRWPDLLERFHGIEHVQTEIELLDEEGSQRVFDLQISPLRDQRGQLQGRLVVSRDITARKQAEEELRAANEKLQSLSHAKDEFVSNVSHELGSPITSIKLYLSLFDKKQGQVSEAYMDSLRREVARLEELFGGLLLLSRLDQDRVGFEPGPVDLNELVGQYVADRQPTAQSKNLTFEFQPASKLEAVSGDSRLLGQVISILLTNAFNYTPAGGQVAVRTQAWQQDGQVWYGFCVQDTGPGIPSDEISHLFERFFRGRVGRASGSPGTGLGLAIAQEIVQRHHGRIEVASNKDAGGGSGALFCVRLPANTSSTS